MYQKRLYKKNEVALENYRRAMKKKNGLKGLLDLGAIVPCAVAIAALPAGVDAARVAMKVLRGE